MRICRSQCPRGVRCGSAAARLLGLWVRIPPVAWMSVSCEFYVFCQVQVSASGWSLVQRTPTECGVSEWDNESSTMMRPWPTMGCCAMVKKNVHGFFFSVKHVKSVWHISNTFIILVPQLKVRECMTVRHVNLRITLTHAWNQLHIRIEYTS